MKIFWPRPLVTLILVLTGFSSLAHAQKTHWNQAFGLYCQFSSIQKTLSLTKGWEGEIEGAAWEDKNAGPATCQLAKAKLNENRKASVIHFGDRCYIEYPSASKLRQLAKHSKHLGLTVQAKLTIDGVSYSGSCGISPMQGSEGGVSGGNGRSSD